jgi:uncharacterized membrane protein
VPRAGSLRRCNAGFDRLLPKGGNVMGNGYYGYGVGSVLLVVLLVILILILI